VRTFVHLSRLREIAPHPRAKKKRGGAAKRFRSGLKSAAGAVRQSPHAREGKSMRGKHPSTRGVARHGKRD
jgi:hypothetical protein